MNVYFATFFWEFSRQADIDPGRRRGRLGHSRLRGRPASVAAVRQARTSAMALLVLSVAVSTTPISLRLLGLMPANHTPALIVIIFCQVIVSTALYIAATTLISAMIADVVEDSQLKTGRRAEDCTAPPPAWWPRPSPASASSPRA